MGGYIMHYIVTYYYKSYPDDEWHFKRRDIYSYTRAWALYFYAIDNPSYKNVRIKGEY